VDVLLRPDDLVIGDGDCGAVRGRIVERAFKGAETLYTLRLPTGTEVLSLMPSHRDHPTGSEVTVSFKGEHLVLFLRD
jgi:iron(III) transport system ATP-binding protein